MTAARAGNADAVKVLLSHGADVNARENYKGQTALMWAAAEHHPEVVKVLLDHGADWKVRSFDRETKLPKLSAASSVSPFARGGVTAFLFAAREGDIETARVMLDAGVDINQVDVDGTNALVFSIMNQHYSFAQVPAGPRRGPEPVGRQRTRGAVCGRGYPQRRLFRAAFEKRERSAAELGDRESTSRARREGEHSTDQESARQKRHGFGRHHLG